MGLGEIKEFDSYGWSEELGRRVTINLYYLRLDAYTLKEL